jgi:putative DNA methylase
MTLPPLLIEHWLPIEAIGAESKRERGASSALPPLYFLHVWWARRPLLTSRAAILASVLPQWSADWPSALRDKFPNEATYHQWFIQLTGIRGDPVKGRKLVEWAKAKGVQLDYHPYGGAPRAFTVNPSAEDLQTMGDLLEYTWGTRELSVLDPFAGGGSIPFEALRYGFTTTANDLNPVAAVILKATLDYPARFGPSLAEDIRKWGNEWARRVKEKLDPYFPKQPGESIFAYLWARTVACPTTGKPVPLSPNWWLRTGSDPVAVKLIAEEGMSEPRFEIVTGAKVKSAKPDVGTITRGVARSPWTGETIDGDYIKAEAQAGRMGQVLYAVAVKIQGGFEFRIPTQADVEASRIAEKALSKKRQQWVAQDVIPTELFPSGNDNRPLSYGMPTWADFFSPRQLLSLGVFLETLRELEIEMQIGMEADKAQAVAIYLATALSKAIDRNAYLSTWIPQRLVIGHVFQRHDFAFVWAYAEFDAAVNLLPWAVGQIQDSTRGLADLASPTQKSFFLIGGVEPVRRLKIYQGSATALNQTASGSVSNITVDPPYYDNVQYAELADFFYVWLKRSVGHLFPDFFRDELTNKDDEAVANPARFTLTPNPSPSKGEGSTGRRGGNARKLAEADYEHKMAAAFREMYRVLRSDDSLTVMFTHKRVEAWDTLASALIGAGFTIKASWPVHTEFEHSMHQAKKNAASSTILLVCRKRVDNQWC